MSVPFKFLLAAVCGLFVTVQAADQDDIRQAVERGEMRPLSEILAAVERDFGGRVLEVELERRRTGPPIYEIEVLNVDGRVLEVEYDSRTGERLRVRGDDEDD